MKIFHFSIYKILLVTFLVSCFCSFANAAPLCPAKKSLAAKEGKLKSIKQVSFNCPVGAGPNEICKIKGLSGTLTDENVKVTDLSKVPCVPNVNYFLEGKAIRVTGGCRGTFLIGSSKLVSICTYAGMEAPEDTCCEGLVYLSGTKICTFPYNAVTLDGLLYKGVPAIENKCEIQLSTDFKKRLMEDEELLGIAENLFTAIDTTGMNFLQRMSENALKAEMNPIMTGTYGLPAILFNTFTNYRYATFLAQKTFRELTDKAMNDSAAAANGGTLKIATVTCPASESDTTDAIHQCSIGGNAVIERAISMSLSERFSATPCLSERVNVNKLPYETQIKLTDDVDDFGFVFGSPDKIWTRGKCRGVFEVRYIPGKEDKNSNEFVLPSDSPYKPLKEQDIYHLVMNNILIGQIAWYEALGKATEELDKDLEQAMQFGSDMAWLCAHKRLCYERKWSLRPVKGKAELLLDPVFSLQAPPKFVQKIKSGKLKGQLKKSIVLKATDWSAFLAWAGQYEHYNYLYTNLNQTGIEKGGEKTSALLREYAVERDFPCLENTKVAKSPTGKIEVPLKLRAAALNLIAYYKTMIELNHNRVTLCRVNPTPVPEGTPTPTMTPGVVPTVSPKTAVFMNPTGVNVADISNSSLTAGSANSAKSSSGDEGTFVSDRLGQGSNFGRAAFFDRAAKRLADAKNAASRFAGTNPAWRKASSLLENMIASNVANNAAAGGLLSSTGTAPSSSLPSSTAASIAGKNILGTGASSVVMKGAGNVAGMQVGAAVDKNSDEDEEVDENADGVDEEEGDASENVAKRPSENLQGPICAYDASRNVFAGPSDNIFVSVMCAYRRHYPEAAQELGIPKLSSEVKK